MIQSSALYRRLGRTPPQAGPARERPPSDRLFAAQYQRRMRAFWLLWEGHVETYGRGVLGSRHDADDKPLRDVFAGLFEASGVQQWLGTLAGQVRHKAGAYVQRVTKIPLRRGIDPRVIEDFRQANVSLIRSLGEDQIQQVADILRPAQAAGQRWEDVADDISDRLDVGYSRAKLIARDQVSKLNGQMQGLQQQAAGVEEYIWRTAGDLAVRGRPGGEYAKSKEDHWALEGTRQRWDSPPLIPGTTEHSHPGGRIRCRCQALPVIPLFDDLF